MIDPNRTDSTPDPDREADFGFRRVPERDKEPLVRAIFESVAPRYDLMNDLMSGGLHRLWKATLVNTLRPRPNMKVLDVAGGTGDIAFRILDAMGGPARCTAAGGHVTVADINAAMLAVGRSRAEERGSAQAMTFVTADAERLPFEDGSADAFTIAFGIRNVTHIENVLLEARRVLRPGGRFLCLEFSRPMLPLLGPIYDRYSFAVIPWLGERVAGDRAAYQYLVESIRRFPEQARFARMIEDAGLARVTVRNLAGGIVALHGAWRL
ncbi:MAG TPA: class I SAM-dependent methyltransferase [Alphaproteobacteria bacterium]|nr:class I SAM-dependent methyltransferase [Alphaproteobacteria bacterium]